MVKLNVPADLLNKRQLHDDNFYERLPKEKSCFPLLKYIMNPWPGLQSFSKITHASIIAKVAKAWFEDKNVAVLDWSAKSPNLNPIANLWGILSRLIYIQGRQFETKESLICCIKEYRN